MFHIRKHCMSPNNPNNEAIRRRAGSLVDAAAGWASARWNGYTPAFAKAFLKDDNTSCFGVLS